MYVSDGVTIFMGCFVSLLAPSSFEYRVSKGYYGLDNADNKILVEGPFPFL